MVLYIHPYVENRIRKYDSWDIFRNNLETVKDHLNSINNGEGIYYLDAVRYSRNHPLDFNQIVITDASNNSCALFQFNNFTLINIKDYN